MQIKLPQKRIPYLGAMYEIAGRVAFMYSIITSVMMTAVSYTTISRLQIIFHSYWTFLATWFLIGMFAALFTWIFIIPSHVQLCAEQSVIDGRNPMQNEILEIKEILIEHVKNTQNL